MRSSFLAVLGTLAALGGMLLIQVDGETVDVELVAGQGAPPVGAAIAQDFIESKHLPSDGGAEFDQFGNSVAASNDGTIVIGAPQTDGGAINAGSVYVYGPDGNGGHIETKLTAPSPGIADLFGDSVAVGGDGTIVIGASGDRQIGLWAGAAYIFEPDGAGGYTSTKLVASDGADNDRFGFSVAISDEGRIYVGAPFHSAPFDRQGAVYEYTPNNTGGYNETKILTTNSIRTSNNFGYSVDASPNGNLAIGARGEDAVNTNGAAYLYRPNQDGSYEVTKFTSEFSGPQPTGTIDARLGSSVAVNDDGILVSGLTNYLNDQNGYPGAVVVFRPNGQGQYEEVLVTAAVSDGRENFGDAVSIAANGTIAASAPRDDVDRGALYILTETGTGYSQTRLVPADVEIADALGLFEGSVSASPNGQHFAIGAFRADVFGFESGKAYSYSRPGLGGVLGTGVEPAGDEGTDFIIEEFDPAGTQGLQFPSCLANVGDSPVQRVCFPNSTMREAYITELLAPENLPRPPDEVIWIGGYEQEPVKP